MRSFIALALIAFASQAMTAPFVVSDPVDPTATHCGFKMDTAARADVPVATSGTNKICRLDLAGVAVGSHTVTATVVVVDTIWGRRESPASANFTFAVSAMPPGPGGLKLVP